MLVISIILLSALKIQLFDAALKWSATLDNFPTSWQVRVGNANLSSIVNDPFNSSVKVLKIIHPKDSCSSFCGIPNGAYFTMYPFANFKGENATFEYSVFFHSTFDFVLGGKLPGIIGGPINDCSGCNQNFTSRDNCFSARLMWGKNGNGDPYLYLPLSVQHEPDFCSLASNCNAACGLHYNETSYFVRNQWNTVKEYIKMNTPGKSDGILKLWINGVEKINYNKMIYRVKSSIAIDGFTVYPFFGGSDYIWKTPVDTYTMYKDFKFYTD